MKILTHTLTLLTLALTLCSFTMKDVEAMLDKAYDAEDAARFEEAIGIYEQCLEATPADSAAWISDICASLLNCHFRLGQIEKALSYGEKGLRIDEELGDKERIASSLGNLASLFITAGRLENAEQYLKRSIRYEIELKSEDKLAVRLGMLAEVYIKQKKPEEAITVARQALELDQKGGREKKAAIRMSQLGNALVCANRAEEAMPYLTDALRLHRKHENRPSEAITLVTLGMAERSRGHSAQAKAYLEACITLAGRVGLPQPLMTAHLELANIYGSEQNPNAYAHLVLYNQLKDSISKQQVQQQISDLEVRYETKQKEQELQRKDLLIQRQRFVYIGLSIVLVLTLAIVAFLIVVVRLKNQNMELKDKFMQVISHDLKNPAIAQQKNLHILAKALGSLSAEEMRDIISRMAEDADAQVNLLYSLLDWAGLQTGRLRYTPISLDLTGAVNNVLSQLRVQATAKDISLQVQVDQDCHIVVADRQMVEAMIRNLLSNAIKFSAVGSSIRISVARNVVEIDDDGIGINASNSESSSGIGLRLVRRLAKVNHATFTITQKKVGGTVAAVAFNAEK